MRLIRDQKEGSAITRVLEQAYNHGLLSKCKTRPVGAIILEKGRMVGRGYTQPQNPENCCVFINNDKNCRAIDAHLICLQDYLERTQQSQSYGTVIYSVSINPNGGRPMTPHRDVMVSQRLLDAGIEKIVPWSKQLREYDMIEYHNLCAEFYKRL